MNVKFIKSKKFLIIVVGIAILLVIISIIFSKKSYETINIGNNNLNKTLEEVEDYILNIKEYTATIEVTVNSNKNSNKYLIKQNHKEKNDEQEVLEPDTIKGVKLTYKDSSLIVENSNLNLEKIYNNYPYIESNILWLNSFIEEYRNSEQRNITEKNEEIVMQIKRKNDKKIAIEELILDKKTLKPTKLSIRDNSKNVIVYILYNEIEIK
jgi:outer membrane lipoprotein-sorting protein